MTALISGKMCSIPGRAAKLEGLDREHLSLAVSTEPGTPSAQGQVW